MKLPLKEPLQQIYYGAPGTGKSHRVNEVSKKYSTIRTTFHPDSDYSTFVGAYKPSMDNAETKVVPVVVNNGIGLEEPSVYKEKKITYKFIKQAFLKAYLGAWKKYSEPSENEDGEQIVEPQFLVIEEINRGNCAQIFGDLFQLLDRQDKNKFSCYPIEADADLQQEIKDAFDNQEEYKLTNAIDVDGVVKDYTSNYKHEDGTPCSLSEDIQSGRILLLPNNLYIWATMNTSDQSLFPIDSAFKRRWDWKYVKIAQGYQKNDNGEFVRDDTDKRVPIKWTITGNEISLDWWTFIQEINSQIATATTSDDKKLGFFFCKPKDGGTEIDTETFVGKVLFYLWNDVFKDNDNSIFNVKGNGEPSFDDFFTENEEGETIASDKAVKKFLVNVMMDEKVVSGKVENEDSAEASTEEEAALETTPTVNENPT